MPSKKRKIRAYDPDGALHTVAHVGEYKLPKWPYTLTVDRVAVTRRQRPPHSWAAQIHGSAQGFELTGIGPCPLKPGDQFTFRRIPKADTKKARK